MYSKKDIEAKQSECIKFYVNYTVHLDLLVKVKLAMSRLETAEDPWASKPRSAIVSSSQSCPFGLTHGGQR